MPVPRKEKNTAAERRATLRVRGRVIDLVFGKEVSRSTPSQPSTSGGFGAPDAGLWRRANFSE
jgi:hypothetical protein